MMTARGTPTTPPTSAGQAVPGSELMTATFGLRLRPPSSAP